MIIGRSRSIGCERSPNVLWSFIFWVGRHYQQWSSPRSSCPRSTTAMFHCRVCRNVTLIDFSPSLMPQLVLWPTSDSCRYDHVTPLLNDLHWLRVPERITYKLCVLVYNVFMARRMQQDVCHSACCWSNVAPSTAVCIVIRSCGASNTSFIAWRPSLCGYWTTRMEQSTWVRHWLLVTSHLQEISQDLFIWFIFLEHDSTV